MSANGEAQEPKARGERRRRTYRDDYARRDAADLSNVSARTGDRVLARVRVPGAYRLNELVRFKCKAFGA